MVVKYISAEDLRWTIFGGLEEEIYRAAIIATGPVVAAGLDEAVREAEELGLQVQAAAREGEVLPPGHPLLELAGNPVNLAVAEDRVTGWIGKASGVTAAARFFSAVLSGKLQVVCGGWKKVPLPWRPLLRRAASLGGAQDAHCGTAFCLFG